MAKDEGAADRPEFVEISGRRLQLLQVNTLERELYWTALLHKGELTHASSYPGETFDQYVTRMGTRVAVSMVGPDLLAMQFTEVGQPWSLASQREIAEFLRWTPPSKLTGKIGPAGARMFKELFDGGTFRFVDEL